MQILYDIYICVNDEKIGIIQDIVKDTPLQPGKPGQLNVIRLVIYSSKLKDIEKFKIMNIDNVLKFLYEQKILMNIEIKYRNGSKETYVDCWFKSYGSTCETGSITIAEDAIILYSDIINE